jgi:hypothetical protein
MLLSSLYISDVQGKGRGVFSSEDIASGETLEVSPVIVMSQDDRVLLDQTLMHEYIFEWGATGGKCCVALGYISVYNHSPVSNCEYQMDYENQTIAIHSVRHIKSGEELTINYNGDWNDPRQVWFELSK